VNIPHPSSDNWRTQDRQDDLARKRTVVQAIADRAQTDGMPAFAIIDEKPVHITVAYLMAAGRTRAEITKITGMSAMLLSNLTKQPWFKTRLKEITDSVGKDMVKAFLEGEVLPSLEVLRTIRDDSEERGATRVQAANSILDRFMGKPTVHVESKTNLNIHSAADAKDQVQSELEKVDAELRRLGVSTSAVARAN